ncbi:toll-like receptor 6 [Discoglossus pictus]
MVVIMRNAADNWNDVCWCIFLLIYMFTPLKCESEFTGLLTLKQLDNVPVDVSPLVTQLDLSQNNIRLLEVKDFKFLLHLKFLNLSHNSIEELDSRVLQFNTALEYLDISHNKLKTINCSSLQFMKNIKELNLSYNNFETMPICKEFSNLTELKFLGLSAAKIGKSDFVNFSHIEFQCIFFGIIDFQKYEAGSLQVLNTKKLHINLPKFLTTLFLLDDTLNTSTTLEVSQIECAHQCVFVIRSLREVIKRSKVSTIILSNITIPWNGMSKILQAIWHSSVENLYIRTFTLVKEFKYVPINFTNGSLKSFTIDHLITKVFFFQHPHPSNTFAEMIVENFTFSNGDMIHFFCPPTPSIFRFLSFDKNRITDEIFQKCENLTALEFFNLRSNKLEKLSKLSAMTSTMKSLKYLDLSQNYLYYEQHEYCNWSASVISLNLSENQLSSSVFSCLPINAQVLDLSRNKIASVTIEVGKINNLKELNLALNRLKDIPDCSNFGGNLAVLKVDENFIDSPSTNFLHSCNYVKSLSAGKNQFQCNCELREFIATEKQSAGKLAGWPDSYICEYPENYRGILLKDFNISELSCNIYILLGTVLGTILVLLLCIIFLCTYFDLPWYISMFFRWIRTKQRVRNINIQDIQDDILFHAFISYSHEDSEWVHGLLIPNLEKNDGTIKLCHHQRDFIPGKAIIDNIIDCIEKSFKSIFVLSPNFIQSEWCHYELYFAQHTLFGKNSNNLILILLDPIPQYLIPNKYNKLKTIMKHRTYIEWPKEKSKHGLFWANLRETVHINLPIKNEVESILNLVHDSVTMTEHITIT